MKARSAVAAVPAVLFLSSAAMADTYVTNFNAVNGSGAMGVWKNVTTATNTSFAVALSQMGSTVRQIDGTSQTSVVDDSFPWQDLPAFPPFIPAPINVFEPNYNGDFINLELLGGSVALVVINLNAIVLDPVLNFTDVDTQTTLVFSDSFTVTGKTPNLVKTGNSVTTNGATIPVFDEECAGSLKFSGTYTRLIFKIVNTGPNPAVDVDRTGFSVATATTPVPLPSIFPSLSIYSDQTNVMITWPHGSINDLRYSNNLNGSWTPVPGANPATAAFWVGLRSTYGAAVFFRGSYQTP